MKEIFPPSCPFLNKYVCKFVYLYVTLLWFLCIFMWKLLISGLDPHLLFFLYIKNALKTLKKIICIYSI